MVEGTPKGGDPHIVLTGPFMEEVHEITVSVLPRSSTGTPGEVSFRVGTGTSRLVPLVTTTYERYRPL